MSPSSAPLPETEYRARVDAVRKWLRSEGRAGLLAVSGYAERDGNVAYLCGHKNAFPYSMRTEAVSGLGYSALLVPTEGDIHLIAPLGYQQSAVVGVDRGRTGTNFTRDLIDAMRDAELTSSELMLAGGDILPAIYLEELKRHFPEVAITYSDEVAKMRRIKSLAELTLIREASKIADKGMIAAIEAIKPGMKESAVGSVARRAALEAGAEYVVRDRIHSGKEMGRLRWPFASSKKLRKGELVSIDLVGWVKSYGFDILRIGCAGRPNKRQVELIQMAGEATKAMSEKLVDKSDVQDSIATLKQFETNNVRVEPFGHGIGLEIVEDPYLFPGVAGMVRKNMVLCIEPTVKIDDGWASIENQIIVGEGGPETLTKLPVLPT